MKKAKTVIFGSFILATICGIFGQDLAYLLNKSYSNIQPIAYLTVLTILSIALFLNSFVMTYFQYKKQRIQKQTLGLYFTGFGVIALLISCSSLFVLAMWWG